MTWVRATKKLACSSSGIPHKNCYCESPHWDEWDQTLHMLPWYLSSGLLFREAAGGDTDVLEWSLALFQFQLWNCGIEQLEMKGMCIFHISVERVPQDMFIEMISGWAAISSILLLYLIHCDVPHKQVVWAGEIAVVLLQDFLWHHPLP